MATRRQKIQGYLRQDLFDLLETYTQESGLNQSQALETIVMTFFGSDRTKEQPTDFKIIQSLIHEIEELKKRVEQLETPPEPVLYDPYDHELEREMFHKYSASKYPND